MKFEYFWQYQDFEDLKTYRDEIRPYVRDYFLNSITNIDTATGYSLDLIGKILGFNRRPIIQDISGFIWNISNWNQENWNDSSGSNITYNYISDDAFRKLLKIRSEQLLKPRTINNLIDFLNGVFTNLQYTIINGIKEVTIEYDASLISLEDKAILKSEYILAPQGCKLTIQGVY